MIGESPYVGLRAFESKDVGRFFGRQRMVSELMARLRGPRFIGVLGLSGEGKSSLVRAGLIPALRAGYLDWNGATWDVVTMRPDVNPLAELARALANSDWGRTTMAGRDASFYYEALNEDPTALARLYHDHAPQSRARLLIVVDQFEELFTRTHKRGYADAWDAELFADALIEATTRSDQIYVLITMRSEYLGNCAEYSALAEAITRGVFLVRRMRPNEVAEAIEMPARLARGSIDPALRDYLVDESMRSDRGRAPLPVLQHALMRMWREAKANGKDNPRLTFRELHGLGGLKLSLNQHLDEVYRTLDPDLKRTTEALFRRITKQTSRDEETGEYRCVRDSAAITDIVGIVGLEEALLTSTPEEYHALRDKARPLTEANVKAVVAKFRDEGNFLEFSGKELGFDSVIDVSHEAVINNWALAKEWAAEEGENARKFQELCERAQNREVLLTDPEEFKRRNTWFKEAKLWYQGPPLSAAWAARYKGKQEFLDFNNAKQFLKDSQEQLDRAKLREAIKSGSLAEIIELVGGVRLAEDSQKFDFASHYFALVPEQIRKAREKGGDDIPGRDQTTASNVARQVKLELDKEDLEWAFPSSGDGYDKLRKSAGGGFRIQHYAAHGGNLDVLKRLGEPQDSDGMGLNFNVETDRRSTPFHLAVANGKLEAAEWLFRKINDRERTIAFADADGDLPLVMAISWKPPPGEEATQPGEETAQLKLVKWLVRNGAKVDEENQSETRPLHWAAQSGNTEVIQYLVGENAVIDAENMFGETPLIVAASENQEAAVRALIAARADVNYEDMDGATPLLASLRSSTPRPALPIISALLEKQADPNAEYPLTGERSLHLAINRSEQQGENASIVIGLVNAGAFVDAKDDSGRTPVTLALAKRNIPMATYLAEHGKRERDTIDPQWLISAASAGARNLIEFLLSKGARADNLHNGTTALHAAAGAGQMGAVAQLATQPGVNLDVEDSAGLTPMRLALVNNNNISAGILARHGARLPSGMEIEAGAERPQIRVWDQIATTLKNQLGNSNKAEWPYAPHMRGEWTHLDADAAIEALRPLFGDVAFLAKTHTEWIDAVRSTPVSFVEGGALCEARMIHDNRVVGYLTFITRRDKGALVLDGAIPIRGLSEILQLKNEAAAVQFLRFYCGAQSMDLGVLTPIESPGDGLLNIKAPKPNDRAALDAAARPIQPLAQDEQATGELWRGEFIAQYGPEIWIIYFGLRANGEVRWSGNHIGGGGLEHCRSAFASGLRTVTFDAPR